MFKKVLLAVFAALLLMSHNAFAVVQSVQFNHSTNVSNIAVGNCSNFQARILNPNADTSYNIDSLCFSVGIADQILAGQFVTISFIIGNISDNNALDARFRDLRGDTSAFQTVDITANNLGNSSAVVDITLFATQNYTSQYFGLYRITTTGGGITLQPNEEIVPLMITVWDTPSSNQGATESTVSNIDGGVTYIHSQLDTLYFQAMRPIKLNTDTINLTTAQIRDLLLAQSSDLEAIADNTENVSDYVDEQRQAYQNMQNTDGLIDIGNQDQALGLVGSINTFLGSITNTAQGNCVLPGDMGNVDLGDLNLCDAPQEVRNTVGTIGGIVLAVVDILIAYHTIKYIVSFIDWARRN